jgi:hypothetical protein
MRQFGRWQIITAIDIITEVALFVFSVFLIYGLQMALKPKLVILVAFAARIPCVFLCNRIQLSIPSLHTNFVTP